VRNPKKKKKGALIEEKVLKKGSTLGHDIYYYAPRKCARGNVSAVEGTAAGGSKIGGEGQCKRGGERPSQ